MDAAGNYQPGLREDQTQKTSQTTPLQLGKAESPQDVTQGSTKEVAEKALKGILKTKSSEKNEKKKTILN